MRLSGSCWLFPLMLVMPLCVVDGAPILPLCGSRTAGMEMPVLRLAEVRDWSQGGPGIVGASTLYHLDDDAWWAQPQAYRGLWQARIAALRFPGGELADNYDWERHAVERAADWPGAAADPQERAARTDFREFIAHAGQAGIAHVFLVVNLDGAFRAAGEREDNLRRYAQRAARWVAEAKRIQAPAIIHWEIGNEPYLGTSFPLTAREYARALQVFAAAMREVDPLARIGAAGPGHLQGIAFADQLGAPGLARLRAGAGNSRRACPGLALPACLAELQQGEAPSDPDVWWPTLMAQAGDSFDYAVIHRYARATPLTGAPFPLTERLRRLRQGLRQGSGRAVPLALTEWNVSGATRHGSLSEMEHLIEIAVQRGNDAVAGVEYALYWPLRPAGAVHRPLLDDDGRPAAVAQLLAMFHQLGDASMLAQEMPAAGVYVLRARAASAYGYLVVNAGPEDRVVELDDAGAQAVHVQQITGDAGGRVLPPHVCDEAGLHPTATRVHAPAGSISLIRSVRRTIRM